MRRRRHAAPIRREESLAAIDLADRRIDYLLKRSSARRVLALRVNAEGLAQINAPLGMPLDRIEAFLIRHAEWLRAQLARGAAAPDWRDGMGLPFLGGELRLQLGGAVGPVVRDGDRLRCGLSGERVKAAVLAWYRQQARAHLLERLHANCRRLGLETPSWRLSDARTRWGSLSVKGVVGLNWRLVKAGPEAIDYVICHELAHFRHRDHSAAYWREVARLYPDYEAARARLRENGRLYMSF